MLCGGLQLSVSFLHLVRLQTLLKLAFFLGGVLPVNSEFALHSASEVVGFPREFHLLRFSDRVVADIIFADTIRFVFK